jgi:hypothetical protein
MGFYALTGLEEDKKIRAVARQYMLADVSKRRDYAKSLTLGSVCEYDHAITPNRLQKCFPKSPDWFKSDQWKPRYPNVRRLHLGSALMGLMDCFPVACLFGQKPDFKSFLRSPDWFISDQWKPR